MNMAIIFVNVFYCYLTIGALFSVWFAAKGAQRIDKDMEGTSWKLRLLLLPGAVLLWPVLAKKYRPIKTKSKIKVE